MLWHNVRKAAKKSYNARKSQYDMNLQQGEIGDAPPQLDLECLEEQFYSEVSGPLGKDDIADVLALRSEVLSMLNAMLKSYRATCTAINQKVCVLLNMLQA